MKNNKWSNYGKWRHPEKWWSIQLIEYFKKMEIDINIYNPKLIKIDKEDIYFETEKCDEILLITKSKIVEIVNPELN